MFDDNYARRHRGNMKTAQITALLGINIHLSDSGADDAHPSTYP